MDAAYNYANYDKNTAIWSGKSSICCCVDLGHPTIGALIHGALHHVFIFSVLKQHHKIT